MLRAFRVGSLLGIPFRLDITFLLILPVFAAVLSGQIGDVVPLLNDTFGTAVDAAPLTDGYVPYVLGTTAAVTLFGCVTLHELGHSVVAEGFGYEVESITLWLLGGIARPTERPDTWREEFWIAVAGPAVNVGITAACLLALLVVPPVDVVVFLLLYLAALNAGLVVFNMLPAFPLDGGRVLRALLARSRPAVRATRQAAAVGKGFAALLALAGIVTVDPFLFAIAVFVYAGAKSESRQMLLQDAMDGVAVGDVMTPADRLTTVEAGLGLAELRDVAAEETGYPVLDEGRFVGMLDAEQLQDGARPGAAVAETMTPAEKLTTVSASTGAVEGFRRLAQDDQPLLPVVEEGQFRGVLTREDLVDSFQTVIEEKRFDDPAAVFRSESG